MRTSPQSNSEINTNEAENMGSDRKKIPKEWYIISPEKKTDII